MPREPDLYVEIVDNADTKVQVIGDQVLDVADAADGELVVVEGGELTTRALDDADIPSTITRDSEAAAAYQPKDATLTGLAGVSTAADKLIYATGVDTFAAADLTAAGRAILDDTSAAAQLVTLGAAPLAGGTMTGELVVPDVSVSGLTGATAGFRFVGATTSGAPVSGTFAVKDLVYDIAGGFFWACTVAGTPGTWVRIGSSGTELGYAENTGLSGSTTTTLSDVSGLTTTVTIGTRPIRIEAVIAANSITGGTGRCEIDIVEGSTTLGIGLSGTASATTVVGTVRATARLAPSAGSHTYKVQARVASATSGSYSSGATFPAYIQVVEC